MKRAQVILFFILISATQAFAEIEGCFFDGDDFYVRNQDSEFRTSVDAGFEGTIYDCTNNLAAIYDGDDLYVFDEKTKRFERNGVDDKVMNAKLSVTENLVGLYDGDDLYVYSSQTQSFDRQGVDDNYKGAALIGTTNGILFYDGDDLYSYCSNKFDRSGSVDDNLIGFANSRGISVGKNLFYLTSQCEIHHWTSDRSIPHRLRP